MVGGSHNASDIWYLGVETLDFMGKGVEKSD